MVAKKTPVVKKATGVAKPVAEKKAPPAKKESSIKIPKSLAACADLYYELKQKRLDADKVAAKLKAEETVLFHHLVNNLSTGDATGAQGKVARATIVIDESYNLTDYDKAWAWAVKNKAPDLFQKRLSKEAVELRVAAGKKIPGIEKVLVKKISLAKL